jgi:hypothetical protein
MSVSFFKVYDIMLKEAQEILPVDTNNEVPLLDSGEDSKTMELIRVGKNLNPEFWDNFMKICNNTEALANLLGISANDITNWTSRIKDALDKVEKTDVGGSRNKMLKTGDDNQGPIQDRDQEKQQLSYPSDTRPTP